MSTLNIQLFYRRSKRHPYIILICLLCLTLSGSNYLYLSKNVRAIGLTVFSHIAAYVFQDCLFVLRFYGRVNPIGLCQVQPVYPTTRLLGRLSPLSG